MKETIAIADPTSAMMVGSNEPRAYRLARKPDGEIVMQGRFDYHALDHSEHSHEWRTLPTVDLPPAM